MKEKTHFRKVFKSDHLGVADLEEMVEDGHSLIFTIKEVKQEINATVAGKKIDANIAYFYDKVKPLVLNATNSMIIRGFMSSPFVEDWKDVNIELYADYGVKMKGQVVGGIRIKKRQPIIAPKVPPTLDGTQWQKAVAAITAKTYTAAQIEAAYSLTDAQKNQINGL